MCLLNKSHFFTVFLSRIFKTMGNSNSNRARRNVRRNPIETITPRTGGPVNGHNYPPPYPPGPNRYPGYPPKNPTYPPKNASNPPKNPAYPQNNPAYPENYYSQYPQNYYSQYPENYSVVPSEKPSKEKIYPQAKPSNVSKI